MKGSGSENEYEQMIKWTFLTDLFIWQDGKTHGKSFENVQNPIMLKSNTTHHSALAP